MDDEASELHASYVRMTDIGDRVVRRAVDARVLRTDVTGADVLTR